MVSWGHQNVVLNMIVPVIFIIKSITLSCQKGKMSKKHILLYPFRWKGFLDAHWHLKKGQENWNYLVFLSLFCQLLAGGQKTAKGYWKPQISQCHATLIRNVLTAALYSPGFQLWILSFLATAVWWTKPGKKTIHSISAKQLNLLKCPW